MPTSPLRRRQSLKSGSQSRHRKSVSVSSVHLEHLDPIVAHRDAQTAAQEAFARAQNRLSTELPLFPPSNSSSPRRSNEGPIFDLRSMNTNADEAAHGQPLVRHPRVRFSRPSFAPSEVSRTRALIQFTLSQHDEPSQLHRQGLVGVHDAEATLVSSNQQHRGMKDTSCSAQDTASLRAMSLVGKYLDVMEAEDQLYTPEDDIASAPSSYRRLRKVRSMFTSEAAGLQRSLDEPNSASFAVPQVPKSSSSRTLAHNVGGGDQYSNRLNLRAPKSMSFLKPRHSRQNSLAGQVNTNDGPDSRVNGSSSLKLKQSFFFTSRDAKGSGRAPIMRKSLRTSSSSHDTPVAPPMSHPPHPDKGKLSGKARTVSRTLKARFKSIFSLSKSESDTMSFPEQHIPSQRTHASVTSKSPSLSLDIYGPCGYEVEKGSLRRVPSNIPSLHTVPSAYALRCSRGSVESTNDEHQRTVSDGSLTSWSNSGPSTLTSQQQRDWTDWERQRLSIIKENGAHAPSPSLRRSPSALDSPLPDDNAQVLHKPGPIVNSQRVYSALMKRLNEIQPAAQPADQQPKRNASQSGSLDVPLTLEGRPDGTAQVSPLTIRAVPPDRGEGGESSKQQYNSPSQHAAQLGYYEKGEGINKEQNCHQRSMEDGSARRGSAVSNSPTAHLFRTGSPYRRALRRSMEYARIFDSPQYSPSSSHQCSVIRKHVQEYADTVGSVSGGSSPDRQSDLHYSESNYSSHENEHESHDITSPGTMSGADMSRDPPVTYRPTRGHQGCSSVSSVDWKTWLAANVARLESSPPKTELNEFQIDVPTVPTYTGSSRRRGHVRERAQTGHDETDVRPSFNLLAPVASPVTPLSAVEPNTMRDSPRELSPKHMTPPREPSQFMAENMSAYSLSIPLIPTRSPLRVTRSAKLQRQGKIRESEDHSVFSTPEFTAAMEKQFNAAKHAEVVTPCPGQRNQVEDNPQRSQTGRSCGSRGLVDMFQNHRPASASRTDGSSRVFI